MRVTLNAQTIRIHISNAFGVSDLPITAALIASPVAPSANASLNETLPGPASGIPGPDGTGASAIQPTTLKMVTFSGSTNYTIPAGALVYSDPISFPVTAGTVLSISLFLAQGQTTNSVTSHPGSRTTSHLAPGNQLAQPDLALVPGAAKTDHWYLLATVEGWSTDPRAATLSVLGDSIADGRGSTVNGNDRWPDQLLARLHNSSAFPAGENGSVSSLYATTGSMALSNVAAGGNRLLYDGLGPSGLARLERDIAAHSAVRWALIFIGVNDIGTCDVDERAQAAMGQRIVLGLDQAVTRLHARGIAVLGATITPFGGEGQTYNHPNREATRRRVNDFIRTGGRFDGIVDFDRAVRDEVVELAVNGTGGSGVLRKEFDTGDHLHLNPAGYKAMAEAVDLSLFEKFKDGVSAAMT